MITFQIEDMTCGHCASKITKAIKATDALATVQIDLSNHRVQIEPKQANATELSKAIKDAGYAPMPV